MAVHPVVLPRDPGDDPEFLAAVQQALTFYVRKFAPEDVFAVRVDAWFGPDVVPTKGNDGRTRLPAFRAEHVLTETWLQKDETGAYTETELTRPLHPSRSEAVTSRPAEDWTESAVFYWYSSGSNTTRRGSIIVIAIEEAARGLGLIQLGKNGSWRVARAHGISMDEAERACGVRARAHGGSDGGER